MQNEQLDERLNKSSASGFSMDAMCPGRQNLLRSLPEEFLNKPDPPDELRERGIRLHEAWRGGRFEELNADELADFEIGEHFRENALQSWLCEIGRADFHTHRETRLWLHDEKTMTPILSGQMDEYDIAGANALILDFKSGWNSTLTTSERNWQLRCYAVLVGKEHPELERIRVGFVKPKESPKAGPDFTEYTREDLVHAERDIRFHLWKTTQPDAQRTPGPHCNWCKAKPFCREAAAMALLPSVSSLAVPVISDASKEGIEKLVSLMTPADLAVIQRRASIINKILEAVKLRLKSMPVEDLAAVGFGFAKPRELKSITNTKDCFDTLKEFGVPEDALWAALTFSNGKVTDAIRLGRGVSKAQAEASLKQFVQQFGVTTQSDPSLKEL